MRVKEITLAKSVTVNIAKYEFLKVDFGMTVENDEGLSTEEVTEELGKEVDQALQAQIDGTLADLNVEHVKVTVSKTVSSGKRKKVQRISRRKR